MDKFEAIFQMSQDPTGLSELGTGRLLDINQAFENWSGYSKAEMIGRTTFELNLWVRSEDRAEIMKLMEVHGEVVDQPAKIRIKNGEIRDVLFAAKIITIDGQAILLSKARDVTEQKKLETVLRQTQKHLRDTLDVAPFGVLMYQLDPNGQLVFIGANRSADKILGVNCKLYIGKTLETAFPPLKHTQIPAAFRKVASSGVPYHNKALEYQDEKVSGCYDLQAVQIGPNRVAVFFEDIAERKHTLESLRISEQHLAATLQAIGDGVISTDVFGRVVGLNAVAEALTGWKEVEARNRPLTEVFRIINAQTRQPVDNPVEAVLREGRIVGLANHTVLIARDGTELQIADSAAPIRLADERIVGVVLVFRDVTESYRMHKRIEESEHRFRELFDCMGSCCAVYEAVDDGEDFVIRGFNKAAERVENVHRENILGKRVTDIFPSVKDFGIFAVFQRVWRTGVSEKFPVGLYRDERLRGWRDNFIYKLPTGEVVAVYEDVTKQKESEEKLKRDEARFRCLSQILQHPADTLQQFLDFALEEAIKLTASKLGYIYFYHAERKEFVLNSWSREVMKECAIANPQTCYALDKTGIWGEAVRQRKPIILNAFHAAHPLKKGYPAGHAHLFKFMTIPVFRGDQIVAVVGMANKAADYDETDVEQLRLLFEAVWSVVERKQAEETLSLKDHELNRYFDASLDLLCIADTDGYFVKMNPEWKRALGWTPAELEGKRFLDFIHPDDLQASLNAVAQLKDQKEVLCFENRYRGKDGTYRWIEWRSLPTGKTIYAAARDVTERKRNEEKLKEKIKELACFNDLTVGRELQMIELKKEVNALLQKTGEPEKYKIIE
jgi:PAS domain S-box-containing protein